MEAEIKPIMTSSSSASDDDDDSSLCSDVEETKRRHDDRCNWCCCILLVVGVVVVVGVIVGVSVPQLLKYTRPHTTSPAHLLPPTPRCGSSCQLSLVESIPENLTYESSAPRHASTYESWIWLLRTAQYNVSIASYYWTLKGFGNISDSTDYQGGNVYDEIVNASRRNVTIRVVQTTPTSEHPDTSSGTLYEKGHIELRNISFRRLLGSGLLHTKLWIVDDAHFYIGSANMDWRSLTQVKELGLFGRNCSCLARDALNMFEVYWSLALPDAIVPKKWDIGLAALTSKDSPASLLVNGTIADVFWASSPPKLCTDLRTDDITALLYVIASAQEFIYIAVMDYLPALIYGTQHKYWPVIDDALRNASYERGISVRLLTSYWPHTEPQQLNFVYSLKAFNDSGRGRIETKFFIIPPLANKSIPFTRVNHNKYMVTDNAAYIGTSNWSEDYFTVTGGVSCIVNQTISTTSTTVQYQLQQIFERDWTSQYSHDYVLIN